MQPDSRAPRHAGAPRHWAAALLAAACAGACTDLPAEAPRPAPAGPAPAAVAATPPPAPMPPPPDPADTAARELIAAHERMRALEAGDLAGEIARLGAALTPASAPEHPQDTLTLSLALMQQHAPGDLARAAELLQALAHDGTARGAVFAPLARLLGDEVDERMHLEDLAERQSAQLREAQHNNQALSEKLEALKAIERSMSTRAPVAAPERR